MYLQLTHSSGIHRTKGCRYERRGRAFQITIDKKVREQLGIQPGDRAVEWVEEGRLVVYFMPKPHSRSLLGILKKPGMEPITDWQALKDRAWATRTAEIMEALEADSRRHREDP